MVNFKKDGWTVKKYEELEKNMMSCRHAMELSDNALGKMAPESIKACETYENANKELKDFEKDVSEGFAFSVEDVDYKPGQEGFAFADLVGRKQLTSHDVHLPIDTYTGIGSSEELTQGGKVTAHDLENYLFTIDSAKDDEVTFDDILKVGLSTREDDPVTIDRAMARTHTVRIINGENKKVFEKLLSAKDPEVFTAYDLIQHINASLCAKAKTIAIIFVNSEGFKKLDVTSADGTPLLKKNFDHFVFMDKYEVVEVDSFTGEDETGEGKVIVLDPSIVNIFVTRVEELYNDSYGFEEYGDRKLVREIIKLSTIEDCAYIHGTI